MYPRTHSEHPQEALLTCAVAEVNIYDVLLRGPNSCVVRTVRTCSSPVRSGLRRHHVMCGVGDLSVQVRCRHMYGC
jgi:hypothetical protein